MSLVLFKSTCKRNWVLWVIFLYVLLMYASIMIMMYDPADMTEINAMMDLFPPQVMHSFGFGSVNSLTTYLASWLYGFLFFAFPLVYCILLANRLVVKMVDNGSFAYLLSTPKSRVSIIATQWCYGIVSLVLLMSAVCGIVIALCHGRLAGELKIPEFLALNFTTLLLNLAAFSICFFCSCLFNESKMATGFGAGIPIVFLLMKMLGGAAPDAKVLTECSLYGLYDPIELVNGVSVAWQNLLFGTIAVVLFAASLLVFRRKRLPL